VAGNEKLDPLSAVVIGVKRDRRVTLWSAGAERLYGVRTEDAIGSPILGLANWAVTPDEFQTIHLMRPGDVFAFYKTVTALDGTSHSMKNYSYCRARFR
jgi:PAS domain-containing protein